MVERAVLQPSPSRALARVARGVAYAAFGLGLSSFWGCAKAPRRPKLEDVARKVAPLPACVSNRSVPGMTGTLKALREEDYWKLVFPSFRPTRWQLPRSARLCSGVKPFKHTAYKGAFLKGGWPLQLAEGALSLGGGPDRLKVAWLRTHIRQDGKEVGPLALVRKRGELSEVFAVGTFDGHPKKTRFGTERLGSDVVVIAEHNGCKGHRGKKPCETSLRVYLPRHGVLDELVRVPIERMAFGRGTEPGVWGVVQYHLTSVASFRKGQLHVLEQVVVTDADGRTVRRAEVEREFVLSDRGKLLDTEDSLWDRVVPRSGGFGYAHLSPAPRPPGF